MEASHVWLLIMATAFATLGVMRIGFRTHKRDYVVGMLCAAIAAALVIFVFTSSIQDHVLSNAEGNRRWAESGFARALVLFGPPIVGGYWVWIWFRSKYSDD